MSEMSTQPKLMMHSGHWYGWQMLPGYTDVPYVSPIKVMNVVPLKSGRSILRLDFFNAFYAQGVQGFSQDLRILKHGATYLVAEIVPEGQSGLPRLELTPCL